MTSPNVAVGHQLATAASLKLTDGTAVEQRRGWLWVGRGEVG